MFYGLPASKILSSISLYFFFFVVTSLGDFYNSDENKTTVLYLSFFVKLYSTIVLLKKGMHYDITITLSDECFKLIPSTQNGFVSLDLIKTKYKKHASLKYKKHAESKIIQL